MKLIFFSSLRDRLLSLVLVALLPAFALIVYNAVREIRLASAEAQKTALTFVRLAAANHEQLIEEAHQLLAILSRLPLMMGDPATCKALLTDLPRRYPNFANFAVSNPAGKTQCVSNPSAQGANFADRPWFQEVLQRRSLVTSDYLIGRISKRPILVFGLPILSQSGDVRGVMTATLELNWLKNLSQQALLPAGSVVSVIDRNGTILARQPDHEKWIGKSHPAAGIIRTILNQRQEGTAETSGVDGITRLYAFTPLGKKNGIEAAYLYIGIPQETAYKNAQTVFKQNLAWMIAVAFLVLGTAWAGSNGLVLRRINALVNISKRLADGDLTARTRLARESDEIGQLAAAFDQMAEALQKREEERQRADQLQAQLAAIVDSSNDAIIGRTSDGIVTSWNKGAEALYGYAAEEMIGRSMKVLIPTDQLDTVTQNFERVKRGERVDSYESVRLRKDGRRVYVWVTISPVKDERGNIIGASTITRDITERKRAEQGLKALNDINLAMTSTLDLSRILQILLEKIEILLPYAAAHIRLIDKLTRKLEPVACRNMDEAKWKAGAEAIQHSIHRTIVQSKGFMVIRNLQKDERVSRREFYRQQGLVSYLGVPLIVKDEVIGVLSLLTREEHEFTREEIQFAETLAEQASIAIHNSQLYEQSKSLLQDLTTNDKQIRALASGLIYAQDDEAKRIAHVLHDESGQLLATVYIALDETAKGLAAPAKEKLKKIKSLLDRVEERLRQLSHELHPAILDHLGLLPGLQFLAQQISKRSRIKITTEGQLNGPSSSLVELTLYRVVQEALNNVVRHSRATKVDVHLIDSERSIRCSIQDDGAGFDPKAVSGWPGRKGSGLGLVGMRERVEALNGTFEICSAPGSGTKLLVTVPKERINGSTNSSS